MIGRKLVELPFTARAPASVLDLGHSGQAP
jgi:hypothetical protein